MATLPPGAPYSTVRFELVENERIVVLHWSPGNTGANPETYSTGELGYR